MGMFYISQAQGKIFQYASKRYPLIFRFEAVGKFDTYFRAETLTENIKSNIEKADFAEEIELKGKKYLITLKKI